MYDIIVTGARVAGSSVGMLLARKGYKVLMLDKDSFPSDTISTHILFGKGQHCLQQWGLLDRVKSHTPLITEMAFHMGPLSLKGAPPTYHGITGVIAPRRFYLDMILINAAVDAGVEFRDNCHVEEILLEEDKVVGVRCKTKSGQIFTAHARMVIGADGRNSLLARTVKAEAHHQYPKQTCWYYAYWTGVPIKALSMFSLPNRAVGVIPTNDNQVCITVTWPANEFTTYRSDVEGNYLKTIREAEQLHALMMDAKRETAFVGMADLPFFFRKPWGNGWALAGDAAYHKDPITGQGMSDAMVYADKLAQALDDGFSGRIPMAEALMKYEQHRDEEVLPMYMLTYEWATLAPPPPEQQALMMALERNDQALSQFLGAITGIVPIPEFFAPENLSQIMNDALSHT